MKSFLLALLFSIIPSVCFAAIALDATSSAGGTQVTSITWSHTTTGTDRLLVVSIGDDASGGTVTGVTYSGVAMTAVAARTSSGTAAIHHWYLVAPATGANNIVVSFSSNVFFGLCTGISFTGVDQTTPIDVSSTGATGTASSSSASITTIRGNSWVACGGYLAPEAGGTITATTGTIGAQIGQNAGVGWNSYIGPVIVEGPQALAQTHNNGNYAIQSYSIKATEIPTVYGEKTTLGSTTSATYVSQKTITLSANTTYFLKVNAAIGGVGGSTHIGVRLLINSVEIAESIHRLEAISYSSIKRLQPYSYIDVYTTGSTSEVVDLQIKSWTGDLVYIDTATIFAMDLTDLTSGSDYIFGEKDDSGSPVTHTTAFVDRASVTFTPGNANDDWAVFGWNKVRVNNASINYEMRINQDSGTAVAPFLTSEGEDVLEELLLELTRVYTLTSASHTFKIQTRDDATGSNEHYMSRIFALRLNAFNQHTFVWNEAPVTAGAPQTFEQIHSLPVTPSVAGNWLLAGSSVLDASLARYASSIFKINGTITPAGADNHYAQYNTDSTNESAFQSTSFNNLPASLQTITVEAKQRTTTSSEIEDRSFFAFSMEPAAGGGGGGGGGGPAPFLPGTSIF